MNAVMKNQLRVTFKYTWPIYVVSALIITLLFNFIFSIVNRLPNYQTLTLFVSGEVTDSKKLENYVLERFKDDELKSFTYIASNPSDSEYHTKLSIPGYNTADVLIIPISKLDNLDVSAFALDLSNELISSYYSGYQLYSQDNLNYGVLLDAQKINDFILLPNEDCYLFLSGKSENTGVYGPKQNIDHDNALNLVKEWGI